MGSDDRRQQSASLSRSRKPQTITKDRCDATVLHHVSQRSRYSDPRDMHNFNNLLLVGCCLVSC